MKKQWTPAEMGRKGGKKSVKSRFEGKTKEEISAMMRTVRRMKIDKEFAKEMGKGTVAALKKTTH